MYEGICELLNQIFKEKSQADGNTEKLGGMMIRKSAMNDKELIQQLMQLCFRDKNNLESYENILG